MRASQLKKGEKATIVSIDAPKVLRDRFNSLGILVGEELLLKEYSLTKKIIEIEISQTLTILRDEEADKIEVAVK